MTPLISEQLKIYNNPIDALASTFNDGEEFLQFIIEHHYIQTTTKHAGCAFIVAINTDDENLDLIREECYNRNIYDLKELEQLEDVEEQYLALKEIYR